MGELSTYSVFGQILATDSSYMMWLPTAKSDCPNLKYYHKDYSFPLESLTDLKLLYSSPSQSENDESLFYIYSHNDMDIIYFPRFGNYIISANEISFFPIGIPDQRLVENFFLSHVFTFYLERQNIITLHASAVEINGKAIAFLPHSGNGKSSIAAKFIQTGYSLLTDDILPIQACDGSFFGNPGYPLMRMCPEQASYFFTDYNHLELVDQLSTKRRVPIGDQQWGEFCNGALPLGAIYIILRRVEDDRSTDIFIDRLSQREAFIELTRYSFGARLADILGKTPQRISTLLNMAKNVPVYKLSYPSGFSFLSEVQEEIVGNTLH